MATQSAPHKQRDESSASTSASPMSELQDHLYQSLLQGRATDVTLVVHGYHWSAEYPLHRVVLTQAGFFRALFTAGFLESTHSPHPATLTLPDSNISRAAFEFCLVRLYGRRLPLHTTPGSVDPNSTPPPPDDSQDAPPAFLMSLLATATYLSIPAIAHLAISAIISSIGPYTVLSYLNFAIGKPISDVQALNKSAAGVTSLAQLVSPISSLLHSTSCLNIDEDSMDTPPNEKHTAGSVDSVHYYGVLSDRIGHACACWLTRWGFDTLVWEHDIETPNAAPCIWRRGGLSPHWVQAILSSNFFFVKSEWHRYEAAKKAVELRRRDGVCEQEELVWEALFEHGIIYAHMTFDQLREISVDHSPTTGQPFVKRSTVYGANWIATDLRNHIMSRPLTANNGGRPQSPSSPGIRDKVLGISHSSKEILASYRSHSIPAKYFEIPDDSVDPFFPDLESSPRAGSPVDEGIFSPVQPSQIGLTNLRGNFTQDNYFGIYEAPRFTASFSSSEANVPSTSKWTTFPPLRFGVEFWDLDCLREKSRLHSQTVWYAGSLFNVYVLVVRKKNAQGAQLGIYLHRQSNVEPIPPMSAFNSISGEGGLAHQCAFDFRSGASPPGSPPNSPILHGMRVRSTSVSPIDTRLKLSINADGTGTISRGSTPSTSRPSSGPAVGTPPFLVNPLFPDQPYRDPRPLISAYFSVTCTSSTGVSVTKFSSGPDVFGIGQSWGWKTSSFRSDEYQCLLPEEGPGNNRMKNSLRATVVLGLV